MSEYAMEFKALAGKVTDWSESTKVDYFKGGLQHEILGWSLGWADPNTVEEWIYLAGEAENMQFQLQQQLCAQSVGWNTAAPSNLAKVVRKTIKSWEEEKA